MGVGAQGDLGGGGGAPKFCPKNDLIHSFGKSSRFSLKLGRFFCPNWGVLKKKKRVFNEIETVFLSKLRWFPTEKKGGLRAHAEENLQGTKLPKKYEIVQKTLNRAKIAQIIWNCPKFWRAIDTLKPSGGASASRPPTSYAYGSRY